jgi:hypothetical protein
MLADYRDEGKQQAGIIGMLANYRYAGQLKASWLLIVTLANYRHAGLL